MIASFDKTAKRAMHMFYYQIRCDQHPASRQSFQTHMQTHTHTHKPQNIILNNLYICQIRIQANALASSFKCYLAKTIMNFSTNLLRNIFLKSLHLPFICLWLVYWHTLIQSETDPFPQNDGKR